jgi:hypothetical protein
MLLQHDPAAARFKEELFAFLGDQRLAARIDS